MGDCYVVRRGGGGGISVSGIRVTASSEAPRAPKEGTIWFRTDKKVPRYIFSESDSVSSLNVESGTVFVRIGMDPAKPYSFVDNKKVALISSLGPSKIWNGTSFDLLEASVFENGVWRVFSRTRLVLYKSGQDLTNVSGAWKGWCRVTEAGSLYIGMNSPNSIGEAYHDKLIDVTSFARLIIQVSSTSVTGKNWKEPYEPSWLQFYMSPDRYDQRIVTQAIYSGGKRDIILDLSQINGLVRFGAKGYSVNNEGCSSAAWITDMYFE